MECYQWGVKGGRMGGTVQRIRSINNRYKIDRGEIKNSIGNGEAKEFIYMTHRHELSGLGMLVGGAVQHTGE